MTKTKQLTTAQLAARARNLIKSGRSLRLLGSARPANSTKYKTGQTVVSVDPKREIQEVTFVRSLRWPSNNGGYQVLNKFGVPITTTNIKSKEEAPNWIKTKR